MSQTRPETPQLRSLSRFAAVMLAVTIAACGGDSDPTISSDEFAPPIEVTFALSVPVIPGITTSPWSWSPSGIPPPPVIW